MHTSESRFQARDTKRSWEGCGTQSVSMISGCSEFDVSPVVNEEMLRNETRGEVRETLDVMDSIASTETLARNSGTTSL
jgi:hypothetical protein